MNQGSPIGVHSIFSRGQILVWLSLLSPLGCTSGAADDEGKPDAGGTLVVLPAPPLGEGVQLRSRLTVPPGGEVFDCRYFVVSEAISVARFEHAYTVGSHHVMLYPTNLQADDVDEEVSFDCTTRGALGQTGVLYGASAPQGELPYPPGVAMTLPAGAVVLLEAHYLNSTDDPIEAEVAINLWAATSAVEMEAGTMFFRNWAIYVPGGEGSVAAATMRCELPAPISLVYATSHMHRRGTAFEGRLVRDGEPDRSLHESMRWDSPSPTIYWPPLDLQAGDVVEFTCAYANDRSEPTIEGTSADSDEMCVFIGGYWPRLPTEAELCMGLGSGPVLDGTMTCEEAVYCMLDAGIGNWVGGQACVRDTCAESASSVSRFVVCVEEHNCWGDPACVSSYCAEQWGACTAATCDASNPVTGG